MERMKLPRSGAAAPYATDGTVQIQPLITGHTPFILTLVQNFQVHFEIGFLFGITQMCCSINRVNMSRILGSVGGIEYSKI